MDAAAEDAALRDLMSAEGAEQLVGPGGVLEGCTMPSMHAALDLSRTAFLAHLKEAGVATLGGRQRIANGVARHARERAAKSAGLPVVYIHLGARPYLEVALRATCHFHPLVYVLGDPTVEALCRRLPTGTVRFVPIGPYRSSEEVARARRCYVHRSSNDATFEFFCYERIFILRRFLASHGISRAMHL
jgi:hypothetical protein